MRGRRAGVAIVINNNYPTTIFNGSKSIVLSTVNAFGGKNTFLAKLVCATGIIIIIIVFVCLFVSRPCSWAIRISTTDKCLWCVCVVGR